MSTQVANTVDWQAQRRSAPPRVITELSRIPGVGPSLAADLFLLGVREVAELRGRNPESMYAELCDRVGARVDRCGGTLAPHVALQAHSAPLGISFYTGAQFPPRYFNDAFVAFHGSWNRDTPTGYKVVRVHAGRRIEVEDFLWGFLDLNSRTTSGRPVDPVMGPDGALYVSDDMTGNIYRVVYTGRPVRRRSDTRREPR